MLYFFNIKEKTLVPCDVITCAAPNKGPSIRYKMASNEEHTQALNSRINFILDIAEENQVETLILGAFGCGAFKQNPHEVAEIFHKHLTATPRCFKKVIFAVPDCNSKNYLEFDKVFNTTTTTTTTNSTTNNQKTSFF